MSQPANVATPATAPCGFVLHDNVVPPGVPVIASVTAELLVVMVLPPASCTFTIGCVAKLTRLTAPLG